MTGAAGFIGMLVALALLRRGDEVVGLDNLNVYYEVGLRQARLGRRSATTGFRFERLEVADAAAPAACSAAAGFDRVVHLAAPASVRFAVTHPQAYAQANLVSFLNVLEDCRHHDIQHLLYASSSSVCGGNRRVPLSEQDAVDHPVSRYAATKQANELMAHRYSRLYDLPITGLRFFTL